MLAFLFRRLIFVSWIMIVVLPNEHISIASLLQTHSCYFVPCNQIVRHIQSENNRFPVECDPRDPHRTPKKSNRAAVVLESLAAEALSLENSDKSLRKLALLKLKEITSSSANKSHEGSLNPLSPEQFFASLIWWGFRKWTKDILILLVNTSFVTSSILLQKRTA